MKFDLHTHHERCGHAVGNLTEYIEAAIRNGLQIIGISDHSPFFAHEEDQYKPWVAMAKSEFPHYIAEVLRLKEAYAGKIEVLLGVESDFFPEHADLYRTIYSNYSVDYIIGSVHVTNGTDLFNRARWEGIDDRGVHREKELYYDLIRQSARSRMFDILGHIDAMKGFYPPFASVGHEIVEETLKVIATCDQTIEVNTSGKTKDCGGWYPSHEILERACFYGIPITFGSDAHTPDRVADDWEQVRILLREIGYKKWAIFRQRNREFLEL